MSKFLLGHDEKVAAWAAARIPWLRTADAFGPCAAWGIIKDENLVGAIVYNNYRPDYGDIELNIIADPGWAGADVFHTVADYVFNKLNCQRVSVTLPKGAKKNRELAEKIGFKMEGVKRKGFYNGVDAVYYGMLRSECKWMKNNEPQRTKAA